jgi:hypothetical protein
MFIQMARYKDKSKAIELRKKGYSYSQIKNELGVGKGTLSEWLRNYPLSEERIRQLRDNNPQRIERYINTRRKEREQKMNLAYAKAKKDIGRFNKRELFLMGFLLYWAEGGKTRSGTVAFSNTDPSMIKAFIIWLKILGIPKDRIKIKLHLYKDMEEEEEVLFWSQHLKIGKDSFKKSWVKSSNMSDLTYKNNFGHGTCNILIHNTILATYILMGIKFIANVISESKTEV